MRPRHLASLLCLLVPSAIAQNQGSLAAKSELAKQALLDGRYQEAASLYRDLLRTIPENSALRLNLALALDKAGQPSATIPEALRVTRANPTSAPAWLLLGLAYQQLNQPASAVAPLREALRLDPANPTALLELGDAELTTGDARNAATHFRALTTREPLLAKAWEGLGRAYLSLSESASRQLGKQAPGSAYLDALARLPDHPPVFDCARHAAACRRDWVSALAESGQPASSENLYVTGVAAALLAEESFSQLASLPPSPEIHAVLADSYQRRNRRLDAVAEWRKAVDLAPTDRLFQARLAESLIRARIYPEAEEILAPLVSQQPENGQWQYLLGNLLLQLKRDEEALPHLKSATDRLPDLLPAHEALGRVYLDLAKPADAVLHLEKARLLDDGSISFALSSAYRQLGRPDEARAALARYQALTKQRSVSIPK